MDTMNNMLNSTLELEDNNQKLALHDLKKLSTKKISSDMNQKEQDELTMLFVKSYINDYINHLNKKETTNNLEYQSHPLESINLDSYSLRSAKHKFDSLNNQMNTVYELFKSDADAYINLQGTNRNVKNMLCKYIIEVYKYLQYMMEFTDYWDISYKLRDLESESNLNKKSIIHNNQLLKASELRIHMLEDQMNDLIMIQSQNKMSS